LLIKDFPMSYFYKQIQKVMATMTTTSEAMNGVETTETVAGAAPESMEVDSTETTTTKATRLPITVSKPTPYTFDLGNLLCNDTNPLPPNPTESDLQSTARDNAQALVNQLLSTLPITRSSDQTSLTIALPGPTTPLPREKSIPAPKEKTKWELFAAKKGIKNTKKDTKLVFDEEKQDWVPKWGYKGKNKDGEGDWLVEVDEKKERKEGEAGDARKEKRAERKERVVRQERRQRANEKRTAKTS